MVQNRTEHGMFCTGDISEFQGNWSWLHRRGAEILVSLVCNGGIVYATDLEGGNIKLKNVTFHLFSNQTPCYDRSIIPMLKTDE